MTLDLIADSRVRVIDLLASEDCVKAIGGVDSVSARSLANNTSVDSKMLGQFSGQTDSNGNIVAVNRDGTPVARYNPNNKTITFNTWVNWKDPSSTRLLDQNDRYAQFDLLAAKAGQVGAASMTAEQFMDLTFPHELSHEYGRGHPRADSKDLDTSIWRDCFK